MKLFTNIHVNRDNLSGFLRSCAVKLEYGFSIPIKKEMDTEHLLINFIRIVLLEQFDGYKWVSGQTCPPCNCREYLLDLLCCGTMKCREIVEESL